ncbi:MAG TPA: efflux transporter outer membrane subunit [Nitrospirota bacterium]|nr:efflux transporter outer membrane subunit [Nitrospirota bacterium]
MSLHHEKLTCGSEAAKTISTRRAEKPRLTGLCAVLLCSMLGCAVGPNFERPKPPSVESYTTGTIPAETVPADGKAQHFEQGAEIISDWWRLFNSPRLDNVVKEAISNNQSMQAAQANLRQSQDLLRAGYGVFYPQLNAGLGASRQKSSPALTGGFNPSSIFNLFTLSASVSYALDVFGGERRAVESLGAQVDFQHATVMATYIALSGNVVNAIIARAGYQEQIKATEQIISFQRDQIKITDARAQAGLIPYSDLLSLQSQLATLEATLPPLQQKLNQTDHLLATLAGRTPAEWTPPEVEWSDLTLPGELPITLPSRFVRQRPDILAAEAQLHSASAEIGVATAALFPSFTLNGAYGVGNNTVSKLFNGNSNFWNLGANVTAPLFHGGTLWFERKAAIDSYQVSLANYRQTVLSAFAQVADTLRALEHDAELVQAQSLAFSSAEEALRLILANYQAGTANYVQVLIANNQYQQAKIGLLQAQAQRYQDTVALFVSLGGGWDGEEKVVDNNPAKN